MKTGKFYVVTLTPLRRAQVFHLNNQNLMIERITENGEFGKWIDAEFGMSQKTANNFTAVYEKFGGKLVNFTNLKPSILYMLAAPSTPDEIIEKPDSEEARIF